MTSAPPPGHDEDHSGPVDPGPGVRWSGDGSLAPRRAPRWGASAATPGAPSELATAAPAPERPVLPPAAIQQRQLVVEGMVLASVARRLGAFFIDLLIKAGILVVVIALARIEVADPLQLPTEIVLGITVLNFGYAFLFGIAGVSPGQRLLHIRIVTLDGSAPGVRRSLVRAVFSVNETLLYVSSVWIFFAGRRQAIHDRVAGTLMVMATREDARPG